MSLVFTQDLLRAELIRRVHAASAGPGSATAPPEAFTLDDLERAAAAAADVAVIAVVHRFDLAGFARSALEFAFAVSAAPERRDAWFRAYTRTLFLAGNPANLARRFLFDQVAADGSVAWSGPAPLDHSIGLRRLLKLFDGGAEIAPPAAPPIETPGASGGNGRLHHLYLATAGVTLSDYLVHLNHTLAEGVLTGAIERGDRILFHHVPRLTGAVGPYRTLRVQRDRGDPTRLRAYACLCD